MTDGNTGIQVAPVSKEEAMNLQSMFAKVAQALVDASNLPERVAALSHELEQVKQDLQYKTIHAEELDKTVHELREQRDAARSEANSLHNELNVSRRDLDRSHQMTGSLQSQIDSLRSDLDKARHDRDDYGLQVLSLEDQVKTWKEKADKARVRLNDVLSVFKPEDEPKPEPENIPAFIPPKEPEASPSPLQSGTTHTEREDTPRTSSQPSEPTPSASPPSYASDDHQTGIVSYKDEHTEPTATQPPANPAGDLANPNPASTEDNRPWYERPPQQAQS